MNPIPISQARDEDLRNAYAALVRAGQRAREIAEQTQTNIVVVRDGKLVIEIPNSSKK